MKSSDEMVAAKPVFNASGHKIGLKRVCQQCKADLPLDYAGGPRYHEYATLCSDFCLWAYRDRITRERR